MGWNTSNPTAVCIGGASLLVGDDSPGFQQQPHMVARSATIKRCSRQYRVVATANAWVISHGPQQRFEKSVKLNSPYFFDTLMTLLEHMEKTAWNVKWMVWHTLLHYLFSKIDRKPDRPRQNLAPRILHLLAHDGLLATWEVKSNKASRNVSILMLLGMLDSRCLPLNEKISG